jgi:hypothetical protein
LAEKILVHEGECQNQDIHTHTHKYTEKDNYMPQSTNMYINISNKDIAIFLGIHKNKQLRNIG